MICVLKVVEGPAMGMKCWLKNDQKLTIGRISSSDFAIPEDHHMSRNHLVVEGVDSTFRIRDVGSSNGTFVNETRISVVELCIGDSIKAGTSVFSVGFEDELSGRTSSNANVGPNQQQNRPAEPNIDISAPIRTMSADAFEFDSEATARYQPNAVPEPEAAFATFDRPTVPTEADAAPSGVEPSGIDSGADQNATERPSRDVPAKFLAEFDCKDGMLLSEQSVGAVDTDAKRIVDLLLASDWNGHISLIVNRQQLDSVECGTLDFSLSTGESYALTETLFLLRSPQKEITLEFFKRCIGKDAAICIATDAPVENSWLLDFIDMLSYPSMLFSLASRSTEQTEALARGVQFVLFEKNEPGKLCLLHDTRMPT